MPSYPYVLGRTLKERVRVILESCPFWSPPFQRVWLSANEVRRELSGCTNRMVGRALRSLRKNGKVKSRRYGKRLYWRLLWTTIDYS